MLLCTFAKLLDFESKAVYFSPSVMADTHLKFLLNQGKNLLQRIGECFSIKNQRESVCHCLRIRIFGISDNTFPIKVLWFTKRFSWPEFFICRVELFRGCFCSDSESFYPVDRIKIVYTSFKNSKLFQATRYSLGFMIE